MFNLWCRQEAVGLRAETLVKLRDPVRAREVLLVLPSEHRATALRRAIVADTGIVLEDHVLAWDRLVSEVASDSRDLVIRRPEQRAILRSLLLQSPQRFPHFVVRDSREPERAVVPAGVLSRLSGAIERLTRDEPPTEPDSDPATSSEELRLLAWLYRRRLEENRAKPVSRVHLDAWRRFDRKQFLERFPGVHVVVVDGFDAVDGVQLEGIKAFARSAQECHVLLDYEPAEFELYPHLSLAFERLEQIGGQVTHRGTSQTLESGASAAASIGDATRWRLFRVPGRAHEVRTIALYLRNEMQECAQKGTQFDPQDYVVCFPELERYADLVTEAFRDLNVPHALAVGSPYVRHPLWELIDRLGASVGTGFAIDAVRRLLQSPLLRRDESNLYQVDPDELDRARRELGAAGGVATFVETLQLHVDRLSQQLPASRSRDTDEVGAATLDLESDIETYKSLARGLSEVVSDCSPLGDTHALSEWPGILRPVLDKLVDGNDLDSAAGMSTTDTYRFARAQARLDDALNRLSACGDVVNGGEPVAFSEYVSLLRLFLQGYRLPAHGPFSAGVPVVGRLEVRGLSPKVLLVGGLVEGDFPRIPAAGTWLDDEADDSDRSVDRELSADRHLFDCFLRMSRTQTLLFQPLADGDNLLLPSQFLEERGIGDGAAESPDSLVDRRITGILPASDAIVEAAMACAGTPAESPMPADISCLRPDELTVLANVAWNIAANEARQSDSRLSNLDGFISDPALLVIARDRAVHQIYSASMLDRIVQCPFRYFAEKVLGLVEVEDDEDGHMPMTIGLVAHSVLFEFYSRWIREGRGAVTATSRKEAAERIADLTETALAQLALTDFTADLALRRLLGYGGRAGFVDGVQAGHEDVVRGHVGLFGAFLDYETRRYESEGLLPPRYFEIGFGMSGRLGQEAHDSYSVEEPVTLDLGQRKIKVRGRADRVDADDRYYVLIDYKTGWKPGVGVQKEGWYVQLPLYLMVFERIFARKGLKLEPAGGVYYSLRPDWAKIDSHFLRDATKNLVGLPRSRCMKDEEFRAAMETVRMRISEGIQRIRDGEFHVTLAGESLACGTCRFARICRKNLERAERLVPAAVRTHS